MRELLGPQPQGFAHARKSLLRPQRENSVGCQQIQSQGAIGRRVAVRLVVTGEVPILRGRRTVRPGCCRRANEMRALCRWKQGDDSGMTTAEYAVGTVAACGFGGVLYKVLTSDAVIKLLTDILRRALTLGF